MAIRPSSAAQIDALVADLGSASAVRRDAAVARLIVMGARAVDRLCAAAAAGTTGARSAALHALEGIGDPRAIDAAVRALDASATAPAGIALLRRLLRGARETDAIAALTAVALDAGRPAPVRIAAGKALADLGETALEPLRGRLAGDGDADVSGWATSRPAPRSRAGTQTSGGGEDLPAADPRAVRRDIVRQRGTASLVALRRLVEGIRAREEALPAPQRGEWMAARAAAHVALADRGSRVALYDLRETLAVSTGPLPVEFLAAITTIGDASCLEPLAAAYARSTASGEEWWRQHLRHTFHTIVQRDRITTRHAAMKKVLARWPAIAGPHA